MEKRKIIIAAILLFFGVFGLWAKGGGEKTPKGFDDVVTTEQLGGPERYLTHLSTDKVIYRTGDVVRVRGVVLHAATRKPHLEYLQAYLSIHSPKGDLLVDSYVEAENGALVYNWTIPSNLGGGEYVVKVNYENWNRRYTPSERSFEVRAYRPPRIKAQITFLKDGYYPGEMVKALCHITRAEGDVPQGAEVAISARVDNREVYSGYTTLDSQGLCEASFSLPLNIESGEGTLLFILNDGGNKETTSKSIPIILNNFNVSFYPEGGDLVAGLENRVYFEARDLKGNPVDVDGVLVDRNDKPVADISSGHEGRGRFSFSPKSADSYILKVNTPDGRELRFPLPGIKGSGVVLQSEKAVYNANEPVKIRLASSEQKNYRVVIYKRENILMENSVAVKERSTTEFPLPAGVDGVLRITVFDGKKPLAERLVFRQPKEKVNVRFIFDKENYAPGDRVNLRVKTADGSGNPVEAFVGFTVTEDTVLQLLDKRDQPPRLPAMALLENEVTELKDAHVYMDNSEALDLLLGTQGWRRFAFFNWNDFMTAYGDKAEKIAALTRYPEPVPEDDWDGGWEFWDFPMPAPPQMMKKEFPMEEEPIRGAAIEEMMEMERPAAEKKEAFAADVDGEFLDEVLKDDLFIDDRMNQAFLRVYAHTRRDGWNPTERIDFTETVYFASAVKTDSSTGEALLTFDLNDNITSYRISAEAYTATGGLGLEEKVFSSVKPFYLEPKMPVNITRGDQVILPLALVNNTTGSLGGTVEVFVNETRIKSLQLSVGGSQRVRKTIPLEFEQIPGKTVVTVKGKFGDFTDTVARTFMIHSAGFPIEINSGGMVGPSSPANLSFTLPQQIVEGSMTSRIIVYPSPVANLTQALEALIRTPSGCFEQTSSTSYPLVMAQQYFTTHTGVDPSLVSRSRENLNAAYGRLTGFECTDRGYEWFGEGAGHEALTAYGLMQFVEMKSVMEVDNRMIDRTRDWLLNRRDGKGGFQRNSRALDSFGGAPADTTNAYITWSLVNSGETAIPKEIDALKELAFHTEDSYIIALGADALWKAGYKDFALTLMGHLAEKQEADGKVGGAVTSITRSGGDSLVVETTSLALLGWLREPKFAPNVEKAVQYIVSRCKQGMFYSTQGTILALKAIILYDQLRAAPKGEGNLSLVLDGKPFGGKVPFSDKHQGVIELADITYGIAPGKHTLAIQMQGGGDMPYSFTLEYNSLTPASSEQCKLSLDTKLADTRLKEGQGTEIMVTVTNKTKEVIPTPIALIGLPGGLVPDYDQLKELVKAGTIDFYEVLDQNVVLYWRHLAAGKVVKLPVNCVADIPGTYTGPASRIHEYYTAEFKDWEPGQQVVIAAQ